MVLIETLREAATPWLSESGAARLVSGLENQEVWQQVVVNALISFLISIKAREAKGEYNN